LIAERASNRRTDAAEPTNGHSTFRQATVFKSFLYKFATVKKSGGSATGTYRSAFRKRFFCHLYWRRRSGTGRLPKSDGRQTRHPWPGRQKTRSI
jgi:hypothetical protein